MTTLLEFPSERAARLHAEFVAEKRRLRWLLSGASDDETTRELDADDEEDDDTCMSCGASFEEAHRAKGTSICESCDGFAGRMTAYFAAMED